MPRPSPYLDLFIVPAGLAALPDHRALLDALQAAGVSDARRAGPRAQALLDGGYKGVRVDRPDQPTLYANRQGGFRVRCPATGESVVPGFSAALGAWRAGGPAALAPCPACGGSHAFAALDMVPPAAIGRGAVVLVDAGSIRLTAAGHATFTELLGAFELVGSRR